MTTAGKIDYSKLFELNDPLANRPLRFLTKQKWLTWEKGYQLFSGEWQPPEPVILEAYMGGQATDIMWSGGGPIFCVSQKVVDLLKEEKFTGWATYPVEVHDRKGEFLPGYHGFTITGRAGEHQLERSQVIYKPLFPGGDPRKVYQGFFFDERRWDGSDIFKLSESSHIIVKKEVRDALKRAKISNVRLTPLLEVEIPATVYDYKNKDNQ